MGVLGLTSYISDNSKSFLVPHELRDCYLVVDGSCVSIQLHKWLSKSYSAFGGNYDEYYEIVKKFFTMLKKCNVKPIVIFDGGYEKKKLKTTLGRVRDLLPLLKALTRGFSKFHFYPLFTKQVFCDVMEELGIPCMQCDFEADMEIAAVARSLDCPVLSYDSDFYIFNVLYIPFSTVHVKPVKCEDSKNYYVRCSIYDVNNLLNKFDGLDSSMLPLIAILLGNDYISSKVFEKFFNHVILPPKRKNISHSQRKVEGVLHWLKKESFESAIQRILFHMESKSAKKVIEAVNACVKDYTNTVVSASVMERLKALIGDTDLVKKPSRFNLPPENQKLYSECRINKFVVDLITLRTYLTIQQVEDVWQGSSHHPSMELIASIYSILAPYLKGSSEPLKLYLTINGNYCSVKLPNKVPDDLKSVTINDILKEPEEIRIKWLCSIVGVANSDIEIVPKSDWSVFILAFLYWVQKLDRHISLAHIHALILMVIANKIVQKSVGYYESYSEFIKSKGNLIKKLKSEPVETGKGENFEEMLNDVTLYEKLAIQTYLMPFRQATENGVGKAYCLSTVHLYSCFQSCLFHVMQLNALLNYPLPHLIISDFYSGTLLFNLYLLVKAKPEVERFGRSLFTNAPNLGAVYAYLWENLCEYSGKTAVVLNTLQKKKKSRKKKSKKTEERTEEEVTFEVYSDGEDGFKSDDYNDENNLFAALRHRVKC